VSNLFNRYGFIAVPVVDSECRLVGIVTVDDAMEVMREEAEEDFAKMAGITPTETSYLKTSVFNIWKARIPWLLLLMISATFSSTILNRFEAALPAVLILFVPMLMDTGGNSGGQTSVTVIRSLSLGDITYQDILSVVWKELRVGLITGLSLGAVAFGKVMLIDRLIMQNPDVTLTVGFAVAIALALTVAISKLIGALLPIGAKRIGFDPAVMASPFITTVVDAASLLLYFFIADSVFSL
jgi:magnesium transporter